MKQLKVGLLIIAIISQLLAPAYASRIKDIASVAGIRSNQLIGYGLVVGLPGTGEQTPFTDQTFRTMLGNFGINIPQNERPKINNVAAVAVHAEIPAFAKPGQTLDVTVSSVGSADSLTGGTLLQTFLKGANGEVYAVAQGSLIVGGLGAEGNDGSKIVINTPTVGRIPGGAIVEREIPTAFAQGDYFTFNLHDSDFTTAKRVANTINGLVGDGMAQAIDATSIRVKAPRELSQRVSYMSTLENLEVEPAMSAAKIIINARTGTIVVGQNVELRPAAVAHGNMQVTISENVQVDQPNPFAGGETAVTPQSIIDVQQDDARMFVFEPGTTLNDLVRAVNQIGAAPGDIIAVLEALKHAGAISGELIVI
ncbi:MULTISPECIES: flagellar basal body P-ring protein FlgI [unclassified Idiomarina]|uniref:flagellar basal body P-ring protein FlgI n=1 Tax=unclassified Idiomarina TaxID=2614829 RepID=UPI0008F8239D|nr:MULTISPECIES: flagellar basal body P-ring protein FlgI [unclassified Idiomarina]MAD53025.1 flagellar basal body P-ring protein FlgI [Idiomarinaceae bacterium]MEC7643383.1 flagellar basal body P-ring protein FlgI [Pseudomonadota bacterium]NQZ04607.1 flagellar basal body P-ring protein FlgI [Idiomarina sp.]OIM99526.1 flagellar biosynthesis protein FlgI [Idiomarina sp. MD25a]